MLGVGRFDSTMWLLGRLARVRSEGPLLRMIGTKSFGLLLGGRGMFGRVVLACVLSGAFRPLLGCLEVSLKKRAAFQIMTLFEFPQQYGSLEPAQQEEQLAVRIGSYQHLCHVLVKFCQHQYYRDAPAYLYIVSCRC